MPNQDEEFTTLKVSKANLNRLFKLKRSSEDTYDDVITAVLNGDLNVSNEDRELLTLLNDPRVKEGMRKLIEKVDNEEMKE